MMVLRSSGVSRPNCARRSSGLIRRNARYFSSSRSTPVDRVRIRRGSRRGGSEDGSGGSCPSVARRTNASIARGLYHSAGGRALRQESSKCRGAIRSVSDARGFYVCGAAVTATPPTPSRTPVFADVEHLVSRGQTWDRDNSPLTVEDQFPPETCDCSEQTASSTLTTAPVQSKRVSEGHRMTVPVPRAALRCGRRHGGGS